MHDIKEEIKASEQRYIDNQKKIDLLKVNEKNRVHYLQEKECSVLKIIQEDYIY